VQTVADLCTNMYSHDDCERPPTTLKDSLVNLCICANVGITFVRRLHEYVMQMFARCIHVTVARCIQTVARHFRETVARHFRETVARIFIANL
jgi:hypothetical protein